ncbi:MAG: D-serine ammonia-lyase [Parasporobacterium sp.]|nr:D-serine ammonia-lyase [Parasporobacterium sp.]
MHKYTEEELRELIEGNPVLAGIKACREIWWENPHCSDPAFARDAEGVDVDEAEARLLRFAPLIRKLFPECGTGIIESELIHVPKLQEALLPDTRIPGRMYIKMDADLPISGSVKARGGIYEVLKFAEKLALENGLRPEDDYSVLAEKKYTDIFRQYTVEVGSTGNLGLSIGMISSALGFGCTVHMSADAKQWKKDLLRSRGVNVMEYDSDYEEAVAQGRAASESNPNSYFIDDENSPHLFEGYAVAGRRVKEQLNGMGINADPAHRIYLIIPCGVGGAPGGITYGFRQEFGENVYVFFAEPTHAPCMTLGLASGLHNRISVKDLGIDGMTEADGLAVGRCSGLVSGQMGMLLNGCFTVADDKLFRRLAQLKDLEGLFIEPSSCAGLEGLQYVIRGGKTFPAPDENSIIIIWATGGNMMPEEEKTRCYERGVK